MQTRSFLFLAIGVLGGASLASAAPVPASSCANNIGNSGFTCNFFETSSGVASQSSDIVFFPSGQLVNPGYIVLLESPGALQTDPTQWSDVLQFINSSGQANSAQLFSIGCNCFPTFATVNAASHAFLVETQTGTGNDFTDSTPFVAGFNTFNIFSAAPNPPGPNPPGPNSVPEPASLALMGSALIFLVALAFTRSVRA